ncbi:MAG TPA: hypothetical protein EYH09_00295 [Candidatus Nanopusillus sp.]|nr:hypothetical protein [Candidatus Nanopusillus sp.]HIP90530.1 hypothetical protein [Candidatus Nanopusillus sp.]
MLSLKDLQNEKIGDKHKLLEVKLIYDQSQFRLETFYFWLVDFLRDGLKLNVEKVSDAFGASAGSFFLGNLGQRMTALLNQGKSLGETINAIARTIISILNEYKLVETRVRLYDDIKSSNPERALAAFKALKSIWMDNVDSQKGGSSLLNLRSRLSFATIADIFMMYELPSKLRELYAKGVISKELYEELSKRNLESLEEKKIINQKVLNIVKSRLEEFYNWIELSEKEIRARRDILKAYLIHEINAFVFYTEFARPYFRLARKLLMKDYNTPDIANVFETAIIELTLLATGGEKEIEEWDDKKDDTRKIKYIPLYEVSMRLRALPTIATQSGNNFMYSYIGRTDFYFRSYLITKEELDEIRVSEEIEDLLYIQGMTEDFLRAVSEAIFNVFLWDHIQRDPNLKAKVAGFLRKSPNEITKPEDIKWSKELVDLIKRERPELLRGIEWIKKYLPKQKTKEDKKEEKKSKDEENAVLSVMPFLEVLYELFEKIVLFILTYPRKIEDIQKQRRKKAIEKKRDEVLKDLKNSTVDLGWTIYNVFKKTFKLLSW